MLASRRQGGLRALHKARPDDFLLAREVEALCHSLAVDCNEYLDHIRRCAYNLKENQTVGKAVVCMSDVSLTTGTLVGRIETERRLRNERFEQMLREKYDSMNDASIGTIVRCRRCGSTEVTWDEKQIRSADEAASIFCSCTTCKNHWVVR